MENLGISSEIPPGSMRGFTAGGKKILVANIGGTFHAMDAVCSHMQGDLTKGKLEGAVVTCPRHGSRYDVTTGKVVQNVSTLVKFATGKVATDLKTYPVRVQDGSLFVDL
ncbi:MAG: Rieske 2Fe-2S domain-containing protein [Methanomicrobiales archaeon]|jgi:nitrite reductase/ring-hydroxylating ferredoxin subunit|nr:Rieske 2Fe-2S domain-containing protein [Methanomicrobiales archaeon]MDD1648293.1 Rieske 2Fe-2S domain-containing protein [Methanomicrobiales archaeon]